jgi:hypothetical protein
MSNKVKKISYVNLEPELVVTNSKKIDVRFPQQIKDEAATPMTGLGSPTEDRFFSPSPLYKAKKSVWPRTLPGTPNTKHKMNI